MTSSRVVMTPGTYARKTAYHIDPLLAASVVIEEQINHRFDHEQYADELWKQRISDAQEQRVWKSF